MNYNKNEKAFYLWQVGKFGESGALAQQGGRAAVDSAAVAASVSCRLAVQCVAIPAAVYGRCAVEGGKKRGHTIFSSSSSSSSSSFFPFFSFPSGDFFFFTRGGEMVIHRWTSFYATLPLSVPLFFADKTWGIHV